MTDYLSQHPLIFGLTQVTAGCAAAFIALGIRPHAELRAAAAQLGHPDPWRLQTSRSARHRFIRLAWRRDVVSFAARLGSTWLASDLGSWAGVIGAAAGGLTAGVMQTQTQHAQAQALGMASTSAIPPDPVPRTSEDFLLVGAHTAASVVSHLIGSVLLMPLLEPLGHGGVMVAVLVGGMAVQPPLRAFRLRTRLGLPRTFSSLFTAGLLESAVVEVYSAVAWVLLSETLGGLAPISLATRLMLNLTRDPLVWIVRGRYPAYPSWL